MMKKLKLKLSSERKSRALLVVLLGLGVSAVAAQQQYGQLEGERRLNGKETWKAFEPVREVLQESSAVIYDGWKSIAYGVVVSADGYLVTKASEIAEVKELNVRINRRHFKAVEVVSSTVEWDVALLKVEAEGLPLIEWEEVEPAHGTWVVSNGSTTQRSRRLRVGIVSANAREVGGGRAPVVLGVSLKTDEESESLAIGKVHEDSGADDAGLKSGDIIVEADGNAVKKMEDLQEVLGAKQPGDQVRLKVRRGEEEREYDVELRKRESVFEEEKTRNDAMSGRYSKRRSNFPRVVQTDLPLSVRSCGGPLLTLDGKCVGMNIARANRCETYSIPSRELRGLIKELMRSVSDGVEKDESTVEESAGESPEVKE